jgi:2,5-didehydrogluconate reductase|nr:aldo/keto reductase [Actinomyces bouchesdurhonensis]
MNTITLNNGVTMPQLGYGVFRIDNAQTERCVAAALDAGYRMIDTAQAYGNEEGVGVAVANSGIPRDEVFLVDKVWGTNYGEGHALRSVEKSLAALRTDYIDLMLIHQPYGDYYGAYRDLESALESGKVRSIGVSNFDAIRTIDIAAFAGVVPAVNQIETHVFWQQKSNHEVMEGLGIHHMS